MGAQGEEAVQAARKAGDIPFGGQLKPYQHIDETELPAFLPRRGTQHELAVPTIETPPLSVFTAAKRLQPDVPGWGAEHYAWLSQHYPAGVQEDALPDVLAAIRAAFTQRPKLTLAGGA